MPLRSQEIAEIARSENRARECRRCSCSNGSAVIVSATARQIVTSWPAVKQVLDRDRRIFAARRRLEAIAEPGAHDGGGVFIHVQIEPAALLDEQRAQIVDAVGVVGMFVAVENGVEPIHVRVEKLLAQIRRSVSIQAPRDAVAAVPLDQKRRSPAAILRIVRIAHAPAQRRPRHARGREPAAENGEQFQRHAADVSSGPTCPQAYVRAGRPRHFAEQAERNFPDVCCARSRQITKRRSVSARTFAVSTT